MTIIILDFGHVQLIQNSPYPTFNFMFCSLVEQIDTVNLVFPNLEEQIDNVTMPGKLKLRIYENSFSRKKHREYQTMQILRT